MIKSLQWQPIEIWPEFGTTARAKMFSMIQTQQEFCVQNFARQISERAARKCGNVWILEWRLSDTTTRKCLTWNFQTTKPNDNGQDDRSRRLNRQNDETIKLFDSNYWIQNLKPWLNFKMNGSQKWCVASERANTNQTARSLQNSKIEISNKMSKIILSLDSIWKR